jgi:hypothetical protein
VRKTINGKETDIPVIDPISVPLMNIDDISVNGSMAFTNDMWYDFSAKSRRTIGITENQILSMGPGTALKVRLNPMVIPVIVENGSSETLVYDERYKNLRINSTGVFVSSTENDTDENNITWETGVRGALSKYTISYKPDGEDSWKEVPQVENSELGWDGYMILNIHSGANSPQSLNYSHNQYFEVVTQGEDGTLNTITLAPTEDENLYLQTSSYINLTGGTGIDVKGQNSMGEAVYLDMMYYKLLNLEIENKFEKDEDSYTVTLSNSDVDNATNCVTINNKVPDNTILSVEFSNDVNNVYSFSVTGSSGESGDFVNLLGFDSPEKIVTENNQIKAGIYYYTIKEEIESLTFAFESNTDNTSIDFKVKPLFVYTDVCYSTSLIEDAVNEWNVNNLFDYTHRPLYDTQILDPLKPNSYFNKSHKYNEFVIPQIANINIKTMNKRN